MTAAAAAVGIALLVFLIYKMVINALPQSSQSPQKFNALMKNMFATVQFSPEQQEKIRPLLAGFWEYAHDTSLGGAEISRNDRLEIKPNGYIWQVDQVKAALPSGEMISVISIANSYLTPFGQTDSKAADMICELLVIRHVYIAGLDTCYIGGARESTWVMQKTPAGLMVDGNHYQPFDTAHRLAAFFPAGALSLVDKISLNPCLPAADPYAKIKALSNTKK